MEPIAFAFFAYSFLTAEPVKYQMSLQLEGDLPLVKWTKGVSTVGVEFEVTGKAGDNGNRAATHKLTKFESTLNGSKLPFTLANVAAFFPETSITFEPGGKILSTNAPKKSMPNAIPGFDAQRFPEMSYLPIEFPKNIDQLGFQWEFERILGDAPMKTKAKLAKVNKGETCMIEFTLSQSVTTYENEGQKSVPKDSAEFEVKTESSGVGVAEFSATGYLTKLNLKMTSKTVGRGIRIDQVFERNLNSELKIQCLNAPKLRSKGV